MSLASIAYNSPYTDPATGITLATSIISVSSVVIYPGRFIQFTYNIGNSGLTPLVSNKTAKLLLTNAALTSSGLNLDTLVSGGSALMTGILDGSITPDLFM